jgi:hypothetical protein
VDRQRGDGFDFGAAMILLCPLILWGFNGYRFRSESGVILLLQPR